MPRCLFATDLHGQLTRYEALLAVMKSETPDAVFLGGDLFPHFGVAAAGEIHDGDFLLDNFAVWLRDLKRELKDRYPHIFCILGNDDPRLFEEEFAQIGTEGLWEYVQGRKVTFGRFTIYGYAEIPPSPFLNKDWEKYDVSRHVDPGCVSPEDGFRTTPMLDETIRYGTIAEDLQQLVGEDDLTDAVMLFHAPPYQSKLDRAALDGKMIEHVPLDVHVGSIAIQRFITRKQPLLSLHGHIHESTRMTGDWRDTIGRTVMFNGAHDGPELSVIRFDLDDPAVAERILI